MISQEKVFKCADCGKEKPEYCRSNIKNICVDCKMRFKDEQRRHEEKRIYQEQWKEWEKL